MASRAKMDAALSPGSTPRHKTQQRLVNARELSLVPNGKSSVDGLKRLLHQTMEPATALLLRMPVPGFATTMGTALAKTIDVETINWSTIPTLVRDYDPQIPTSGGAVSLLGNNLHQPVVLLRDPVVAYIIRTVRPIADTQPSQYVGQHGFVLKPESLLPGGFHFYLDETASQNLVLTKLTHTQGWKPYGSSTVAGQVQNSRVIWLDASPTANGSGTVRVDIRASSAFTLGDITLEVVRHSDGENSVVFLANPFPTAGSNTISSASVIITYSGYYSFHINGGQKLNTTEVELVEFAVTVRTQFAYNHVVMESLVNKERIIDQLRVNGASMLLTNSVPKINLGGTCYGLQITGEQPWYTYFSELKIISNANTNQKYTGDWGVGMYTYVKPQGASPLQLEDVYRRPSGDPVTNPLPMFRPFRGTGAVVALIVPPAVEQGTAQFATSQFTLQVVRAIEYTTRDQFFQVEPPELSPSVYDAYAAQLGMMPQFYENKFHWTDITNFIGRAAATLTAWSPHLSLAGQGILGAAKFIDTLAKNHEHGGPLRRTPGPD
jgi:hypothetical protein